MSQLCFEMVVADVFVLPGRGVVASGTAAHGEFHSGTVVQIWHDGQLHGASVAFAELHARPGTVAVVLIDPEAQVEAGDHIRGPLLRP